MDTLVRKKSLILCLIATTGLASCTFQPLYAPNATINGEVSTTLSQISVAEVTTRVGQQVRNHLLFLLHGANEYPGARYEARLVVSTFKRNHSAQASTTDTTAGFVTVTTSYNLVDTTTKKSVAIGSRKASASYDKTTQSFATIRAVRDAENRAGKDVAEQVRLALAAHLR